MAAGRSFLRRFTKYTVLCAGVGALSCTLLHSPDFYDEFERWVMMPLAGKLDPEMAHRAALWAVRLRIPPADTDYRPHCLRTTVMGMTFDNPIGLAAGFDKDCEAITGLSRLGFGFVEGGSVTPLPQPGNPKPRVFRLPEDKAVINSYGFPSKGIEVVNANLEWTGRYYKKQPEVKKPSLPSSQGVVLSFHVPEIIVNTVVKIIFPHRSCIVGLNLGINKTSSNPVNDYCKGVSKLGAYSDYIVVNVSSPNTPGLRDLQHREKLVRLLGHVSARVEREQRSSGGHRCRALLLKISPDLGEEQLQDVLEVVMDPQYRVSGVIVSNTTLSRPDTLQSENKERRGGLSGLPLKDKSTDMIRKVFTLTNGTVPIIGVGGVRSGADAYEKIKAGASLVQLYTGLVYEGPGLVRRMKRELAELVMMDGYRNVQMAVGADVEGVENRTLGRIHEDFLHLLHRNQLVEPLELPPQ